MIDVADKELQQIRAILKKHVPGYEVRAFGSRVNGNSKPYSDLDLVVVGPEKLDLITMFQIQEAFEASTLPFRVDMLDWYAISEGFQKVISQKYELIQKS